MTETPQEATTDLVDAPADVPEDTAKGYAVYDRSIGQFVGPVTEDKPSQAKADKAVAKGHRAAVVRV